MANTTPRRIKAIVEMFLCSEYFASWQAEHIESGSYSRDSDKRDRFNRCYDASENGADGSTHREHIDDMRKAFRDYLRYGREKRSAMAEFPYRLESAIDAHWDALEQWHTDNGSIDQEVG